MPAEFWADCVGVSGDAATRKMGSDHLDNHPAAHKSNKELWRKLKSCTGVEGERRVSVSLG